MKWQELAYYQRRRQALSDAVAVRSICGKEQPDLLSETDSGCPLPHMKHALKIFLSLYSEHEL
jgi:hypothetical protein